MALNKYKLGALLEPYEQRNRELTIKLFQGISTNKEFTTPRQVADDIASAKIVPKGYFAYNKATTRNGEKISIAYREGETCAVSGAYQVFYIKRTDLLLPEFLLMFFKRCEFDRYARSRSWGSAHEFFTWEAMCDVEIELPSIDIQQKYVNVYQAMVANQKVYEKGLDDLKLVCDAYIENLSECEYKILGNYIERNTLKNQDEKFDKTQIKGFNNEGEFIRPMRLFSGEISTFKIIRKHDFVYNSRINSTITKLSIALNESDDLIVSPAYESFSIRDTDKLDPYYLYMLLQREHFAKKVLFNSFGSSTLVFGFDDLGEVKIPIPNIQIQRAIANMYRVYKKRRSINEKLKTQIKDICPILIQGAIKEGKQEE